MILIALRDAFQQSLIGYYLDKQGYQTAEPRQFNYAIQPTTDRLTVITDDVMQSWPTAAQTDLIWLVDCSSGFSPGADLPKTVRGVLCSQSDADELLTCIHQVELGRQYISGQLLRTIGRPESTDTTAAQLSKLSRRELEVFDLIRQGLSMNKIADKLFISIHTAENHRANIQKKLALSGRLSLVRYAAVAASATK
ncbi:response regulator transcription factor [Fibrella aquatilis]|uniref:Response regulator transcription factor n=1 Tax=Fibrella aquatilis TaxID=2817059 RepID=A0A939GAQ7_9BACT|nr:response regulator transcription factor [Fibrella aquatilis]MBO0934100.1 response regulator transcription factor [Fibrella aquatilis]